MEIEKFIIEYFKPAEVNRKIFSRGVEPQKRKKDGVYTFVKKLNDISRSCGIGIDSFSDIFLVPSKPDEIFSYDPVTLKIKKRNRNE